MFGTCDDQLYPLTANPAHTSGVTISFAMPNAPLQVGQYRFTAFASALKDLAGNALDGNGDGTAGDDYVRTFGIATANGIVLENTSNDSQATAMALSLTEAPAGSGLWLSQRGIGSIQTASDVDYWSFSAMAGDVVSVSVDRYQDSGLIPAVTLYDAAGGGLTSNCTGGPNYGAFISNYTFPTTGTYYISVTGNSNGYENTTGAYQTHVELTRGIQQERDAGFSNDSTGGANIISLVHGAPGHLVATVAGTTMAANGSNMDEDLFQLGTLSAGNVLELSTRLPSTSSWNGVVTAVDASGVAVTDQDGNPANGHFRGTIPSDGTYYAKVQPLWSYGGHTYAPTDSSLTWSQTEAYAQAFGGHLAMINDAAENEWIRTTFSASFGNLWIGFTDQVTEGTFLWSSGQAASYTNWASGQPNNYDDWWGGSDANCAVFQTDGNWNDLRGERGFQGLIELDGSGNGGTGAGPQAQYILGVDVADSVAPRVTAVNPLPANNSSTNRVLDRLTVTVSKDLDPLTVNSSRFDLREAGADGAFDTADDVIYSPGVDPYTSGLSVGMLIQDGPLANGHYRFTAKSTLLDRSGNSLDAYMQVFDVNLPSGFVFEGHSNDTLQTATPLTLAEDPAGSGLLVGGRGIGSIQTNDAGDWWSFQALAGDVVSVSVDRYQDTGLVPNVTLYNAEGGGLTSNYNGGPNYGAFISNYTVSTSGTYYISVTGNTYWYGNTTGAYQTHMELARGIQQENDAGFSNDSTSGANIISLAHGAPGHLVATVAGTVTTASDKDLFALGTRSAGNVVELSTTLPASGTLVPRVTVVNASGVTMADEDGNATDGHFRGTIPADGAYYAKIECVAPGAVLSHGGHWYTVSNSGMGWPDAEAYAQGMGGHLATINDAAEQDWLAQNFSNVWIGLTDQTTEGTFLWSSGQAASYTNWASGQPNDYDDEWSGEADAAALRGDGTWADYRLDHSFYSLAELEFNPGSPGPQAQYILGVDVADLVPPKVTAVSPLPANNGTTNRVLDRLTVTVSKDLDAATVIGTPKYFNGHYYLLTPTAVTWTNAEAYAQSVGGHLTTIDDAAENEWVRTTFSSSLWIGFTDQATEGTFLWSSGQAAGYTNWALGQPNNYDDWYGGSDANCALFQTDGTWNDLRGERAVQGLIELDSPPATSFDLREAGLDSEFDTADDVIYSPGVDPYTSGLSVGMLIQGGPLGNGHYRFTANATLKDRSGNPLDAYTQVFDVNLPSGFVFEGHSNDTLQTATPLTLAEDPAGSGLLVGGRGIGSIQTNDAGDWWSFQALAGDVVSVSVDRYQDSGLVPNVTLYNAEGGGLTSNYDGGPNYGAFISNYTVATSGTYYISVTGNTYWYGNTTGAYQMHMELARGIQQESDAGFSNDSTSGANIISLAHGAPGHLVATVAGTVTTASDKDLFALGTRSAGNVVELSTTLPASGTLVPRVTVVNASGVTMADEDGNATDGHFRGTIPADGAYYAKIECVAPGAVLSHGGHWYTVSNSGMGWPDAEAYAQGMGGHLATINDAAEQDWLAQNFSNVWIGLTDQTTEGTFLWSSGQAASYTNWASGQPNDYDDEWSGEADAAALRGDGTWADYRLDHSFYSLAELEFNPGSPGPQAQYILGVDVADLVPPKVTAVSPLPANNGTTNRVLDRLTVTVSKDLDAATVIGTPKYFNGHYYLLTPTAVTWTNAEAYAQSVGGHLTTIDDAAENEWVRTTFSSSLWIGFTDQATEGTFLWSSGQAAGYTNWALGQPNNYDDWYGGSDANCALFQTDGTWNDLRGERAVQGLIELDSPPATSFDLREAGLDSEFDTADDVIYSPGVDPYTSGLSVGMLIQGGPLGNGHYRFTANATLKDRSGNPLDAYTQVFDVNLPTGFVFEGHSNDTLQTATPLTLAEDPAGSGLLVGGHGIGSIQTTSDVDYWTFSALAGDVVSVSVDRYQDTGLMPTVTLYNAEGGGLTSNYNGGPNYGAFISNYTVATSGTYYISVTGNTYWYGNTTGAYQMHMELARGIQQESDAGFSNDSTSGANIISLAHGAPGHLVATVAGTVTTASDKDLFALGTRSAGNVVELSTTLPASGTLVPRVTVVNASGVTMADEDGNATDGHFRGTIPADGAYYAKIECVAPGAVLSHGGHWYTVSNSGMGWPDAEAYAQGMGGHLATINDAAEQDWLAQNFSNVWIGLTDQTTEGTFLWSSGQAASYTNWASGQPNDYDDEWSGEADAAALRGDGTWADYRLDHSFYSLAELEFNPGSPGPQAQYILGVDVADLVPPKVTAVSPLPANNGTTNRVLDRLTVTVSKDLDAATVIGTPKYFNGHYYLLTPTAVTWTNAEAYAQSVGGHLTTIDDAAENEWVRTTFSSSLWIGFTDQATEGTFLWSSGQAAGYTNWALGQPNNYDDWYGGSDANCALFQTDGTWNDLRGERAVQGTNRVGFTSGYQL